jgi:hypothetical protein
MHQDWLTSESIVIALSMHSPGGIRIMIQFVLRVKGGLKMAEDALTAIRAHLLGAVIKPQ